MLKLQSPRSTEFPSAAGDLEESGSESTDSLRTHGVSFQSCAAEPLREISLNDPDPIFLYQANPNLQHEPYPKRFTVLTWNACAISFPLHIHPTKFVLGLILGCWWHDRYCDVPMRLDQDSAQARFARQAAYIQDSGADLVLLQEVLSTLMVQSLMRHLSDFDHTYLTSSPKPAAWVLWTGFVALVSLAQCILIEVPFCALRGTEGVWLSFFVRWMILATILALRWRNSVPAHFLLGDVAGQLVVLRRKESKALAGAEFGAEERHDDPLKKPESAIEASSWLNVFFNVRPRGVLRVRVPLKRAPRPAVLTLLNTHMPHNCDNSDLLQSLGRFAGDLAKQGPVILAGDFNPLPDIPLQNQLDPLLQNGLQAAGGLDDELCTWDLNQALTRENAGTPRTMQLDFIFHVCPEARVPGASEDVCTSGLGGYGDHGSIESCGSYDFLDLTALRTTIADQEKFFCEGDPLSDHYGLISEFQID
ncbi:unnamed protein product [Symbiodinium necroappetens]|uniref:Endonuclease/exonuclease/phosphatase domain-containing protein n=1 Tax=Symbiodinium necroappetens TaxID=1628268 RepID=A0A812QUV2_9DINO|nr:unnamed protein product [Symbiodinium necroappetens]